MVRLLSTGLLTTVLLALCGARAQALEKVSAVVSYADLDVTTAVGARALYARIRSVAGSICATAQQEPGRTQLQRDMHERRCVRSAVESGVRGVNAPELTRLAGLTPPLLLAGR